KKVMGTPYDGAALLGIHLEGPCLAPEYKGAMPERLLMKTAELGLFEAYQRAAEGAIRYITLSPEVAGVPALIPELRRLGITVAVGHSGADYETAMACIRAGAQAGTHVGNAMRLFHQHEPAIFGAILESDLYCETICDGRHLHPASVRLFLKTKGWDRVVAVTDSIMAAGLPDGRYQLGVNDVEVVDGDAKLAGGGARAGSTLTLIQALRNLVQFTARPPEECVALMTRNPAALMGFTGKGTLAPGMDADLVILDKSLNVRHTVVGGRTVYSA
ncbi:MAG: amidohydrolase family protein, partial [Pseudoflavonifractor sp.]